MALDSSNLFAGLADPESGEVITELLRRRNLRIERIVSSSCPNGGTYLQQQDEWVILLEGIAVLDIAGDVLHLSPGDHVFIPAHTPHRVLTTTPDPRCVWLAVHLFPEGREIAP